MYNKCIQLLFKKGSQWRGYHTEYGEIIPDGALLNIIRRSSYIDNIALINVSSYTKPCKQDMYEVLGIPLNPILPTIQTFNDMLTPNESIAIKDESITVFTYGGYYVLVGIRGEFRFFTTIDGDPTIIKYVYRKDTDNVFTDFLEPLISNMVDVDISTLHLPVEACRYNFNMDEENLTSLEVELLLEEHSTPLYIGYTEE